MQTFTLALSLALPYLVTAAPTTANTTTTTYYTLTGANAQTSNSSVANLINQHELLPYYESFWFGLPRDHWCKAPQSGEYTNFTCNPDSYKPLYTVDSILELATSYVTNRIVKAASGQMTYAYASATGGWTVMADGLLAYGGVTQFYACPEQRGDAPTAYQVWHDSQEASERGACVALNVRAVSQQGVNVGELPYGYSGN